MPIFITSLITFLIIYGELLRKNKSDKTNLRRIRVQDGTRIGNTILGLTVGVRAELIWKSSAKVVKGHVS